MSKHVYSFGGKSADGDGKMKEILGKPSVKEPPPRQAYSGWCKQGGYYFSTYYHQPKPGGEYKSHRVIYYQPKGQYLFYYDPYTKKYWGRYDLEAKGYSLLLRSTSYIRERRRH